MWAFSAVVATGKIRIVEFVRSWVVVVYLLLVDARKYTGGPGKSVLNHFTGTMSRDAAGSLVQKGFYARSV